MNRFSFPDLGYHYNSVNIDYLKNNRKHHNIWPGRLERQNKLTASMQSGKTPTTSVLVMTLNNLMVSLQ